MEIKKLAVVGAAGSMGSQIAEILSRVGEYNVNIVDMNEEFINKAFKTIDERMERFFVAKGKMTADEKKAVIARLNGNTSIEDAVKDADFIIEAVIENLDLKKKIFTQLNESAPQHASAVSPVVTRSGTRTGSPSSGGPTDARSPPPARCAATGAKTSRPWKVSLRSGRATPT